MFFLNATWHLLDSYNYVFMEGSQPREFVCIFLARYAKLHPLEREWNDKNVWLRKMIFKWDKAIVILHFFKYQHVLSS